MKIDNSAWRDLPNAHHIDWVLPSLRDNPKLWAEAREAARNATWEAAWDAAREAAWDATWKAARNATWEAAQNATWEAARNAARTATWYAARYAARNAARTATWYAARYAALDALAALVAYDDCDQYLQMTYEELKVYAILSERPQAILLLPMKCVQQHECLVSFSECGSH